MRDPVTTTTATTSTTPATTAAPVEPTSAPAARKRAARAPRAKAAVAAPAPEVVAPVEAPKPVTPAKKAAVRKPAKAVKPAEAPQPAAVKHKLIRDSFTFPENEYAQIEALKHKALSLAHHAKKSEILRAGIAALSALPDEALVAALKAVLPLKPGRPKSGKKR